MTTPTTPHSSGSATRNFRVVAIVRRSVLAAIALVRAWKHRREVNDLLRLDDRMLKDIGLVRSDVLGALAEPLGADPSVGLRLRSVENRLRQCDRTHQVERLKPPGPNRQATTLPLVKAAA